MKNKNVVPLNDPEEYKVFLKALLVFLDKVCRQNGIEYTVIAGTLLGAVRHKDMIPWDDDIDVAMTIDNMLKFMRFMEDKYKGRYYLDYMPTHTFKKFGRIDYPSFMVQLVDKKSSSCRYRIDILPIDYLGDDFTKANKTVLKYHRFFKAGVASCNFHLPPITKAKSFFQNFRNVLIHAFHPILFIMHWVYSAFYYPLYFRFRTRYLNWPKQSKYYGIHCFLDNSSIYDVAKTPIEYTDYQFGNFQVRGLKNADDYLSRFYGDYMTPPPAEARNKNHSAADFYRHKVVLDEELTDLLKIVRNGR